MKFQQEPAVCDQIEMILSNSMWIIVPPSSLLFFLDIAVKHGQTLWRNRVLPALSVFSFSVKVREHVLDSKTGYCSFSWHKNHVGNLSGYRIHQSGRKWCSPGYVSLVCSKGRYAKLVRSLLDHTPRPY